MKKFSSLGFLALGAATWLATAGSARATVVLTQSGSFPTSGTSTQTGRLSRNAIPQDFSGTETFPGSNNTASTFSYITFTLTSSQLGPNPYVQIELDSQGAGLFASAYANSYTPPSASNAAGSFQTNWLGDQGSSGNYNFTTLPLNAPDISFFGVAVPKGSDLVIVLSTSGAVTGGVGAGAGTAYSLTVENFNSTTYNAAVPEPSTWAAMLTGALSLGWMIRRRLSSVV